MYDVYDNRGMYEDNNNNIYIFYILMHMQMNFQTTIKIFQERQRQVQKYIQHGQTI